MEKIEIRVAMLRDVEQIQRLNEEFWRYNAELMPYFFQPGKDSGEYPRNMINGEGSDLIIAVENDAIVGLACVISSKTMPYGLHAGI